MEVLRLIRKSTLFRSCRVDQSFGSGRDLMGRGGIFQADTKEDWINVVDYFLFLRRRQSLCVFVFAFSAHEAPFEIEVYPKRNNLLSFCSHHENMPI